MSEQDNNVFRWKMAIPGTVVTALIQGLLGLISYHASQNNSGEVVKSSAEVVKSISELSHKVEIIAMKQESTDARFLAIESENRRLAEHVGQIEQAEHTKK
ncbi:MAG: hypothetical protein V4525_10925 [Pseudomonadota bacterium]